MTKNGTTAYTVLHPRHGDDRHTHPVTDTPEQVLINLSRCMRIIEICKLTVRFTDMRMPTCTRAVARDHEQASTPASNKLKRQLTARAATLRIREHVHMPLRRRSNEPSAIATTQCVTMSRSRAVSLGVNLTMEVSQKADSRATSLPWLQLVH